MIKKLESFDEFQEMLTETGSIKVDKNTILYYTASWCQPCKMLGPILEEIAQENDVDVKKIDTDEIPKAAEHLEVSSVPSLFFVPKGEGRMFWAVGLHPKNKIQSFIDEYFDGD